MVLRLGFYQGHHIRDGHIVLFDLFGNSKGNLPLFEAITEPVRFFGISDGSIDLGHQHFIAAQIVI